MGCNLTQYFSEHTVYLNLHSPLLKLCSFGSDGPFSQVIHLWGQFEMYRSSEDRNACDRKRKGSSLQHSSEGPEIGHLSPSQARMKRQLSRTEPRKYLWLFFRGKEFCLGWCPQANQAKLGKKFNTR